MIIWRGWGMGLALIGGAVFILFPMAVHAAMGDGYWESHQPLLSGVDGIVAGAVVLLLRLTVLRPTRQVLTDPESGHTYNFKLQHDIFWIDVLWLSLLVMALGVWQIVTGDVWSSEFSASHQGSLNERIAFWGVVGGAIALTVLAFAFRSRDTPDQAYHSPLMVLGMVLGLPLAYAFANVFILEAIERGETLILIGGAAALFLYALGTLQVAAYKISWNEHTFRVRRLLGGTTEVLWTEVRSITMYAADAFEMTTENPRLKRHTFSNHLIGSERFVAMLQRRRGENTAAPGTATFEGGLRGL